jgi:hypothetical protein
MIWETVDFVKELSREVIASSYLNCSLDCKSGFIDGGISSLPASRALELYTSAFLPTLRVRFFIFDFWRGKLRKFCWVRST